MFRCTNGDRQNAVKVNLGIKCADGCRLFVLEKFCFFPCRHQIEVYIWTCEALSTILSFQIIIGISIAMWIYWIFIVLWMQRYCNDLTESSHYFLFYTLLSTCLVNKWNKLNFCYVSCPSNMQRQFSFFKLVFFFPWLVGRFYNFELTQNRDPPPPPPPKKWSYMY